MTQTLLITGGAGFIGSSFVRLCVSRGYKVVVLDALTYAGHRENIAGVPNCELVIGDITDSSLVNELLKKHTPTALVNFAAESHVDNSIADANAFITTNITGTYHLLQAARAHDASMRFVQISTDEVFGSLPETGYFTEQSPYAPNSPYSASKAAADQLVRAWHHTYGMNTIITHCSNNYGARQLPEKLIPVIITRALADEKLPVYGDGKNIRDWIHVEDHCSGILLALEKGKAGESYCFGGKTEMSNIDMVNAICTYLDKKAPRSDGKSYCEQIAFVTDRLGHDKRYAIDDSRASRELGFTRAWAFPEGLRDTIDWYIDNKSWCNSTRRKTA